MHSPVDGDSCDPSADIVDFSSDALNLLDENYSTEKSCWDQLEPALSEAKTVPSFLFSSSPSSLSTTYFQMGSNGLAPAHPPPPPPLSSASDPLSSQHVTSSSSNISSSFNLSSMTMRPVIGGGGGGVSVPTGDAISAEFASAATLSLCRGNMGIVRPPNPSQALRVFPGGGGGCEPSGPHFLSHKTSLSQPVLQLKAAISQAPREVLMLMLQFLLEEPRGDLFLAIKNCYDIASNLVGGGVAGETIDGVSSGLHFKSLSSSATNATSGMSSSPPLSVHHPAQMFLDPSTLGMPAAHGMTGGNNNNNNNNNNSSKASYRSVAPSSNSSPTKRKGGAGNRGHKNYKEEEQAVCSTHFQLRPMKHLQKNEETSQWECIPGYHCLVESPTGSPRAAGGGGPISSVASVFTGKNSSVMLTTMTSDAGSGAGVGGGIHHSTHASFSSSNPTSVQSSINLPLGISSTPEAVEGSASSFTEHPHRGSGVKKGDHSSDGRGGGSSFPVQHSNHRVVIGASNMPSHGNHSSRFNGNNNSNKQYDGIDSSMSTASSLSASSGINYNAHFSYLLESQQQQQRLSKEAQLRKHQDALFRPSTQESASGVLYPSPLNPDLGSIVPGFFATPAPTFNVGGGPCAS